MAKKNNGEGSVRLLPDGSYECVIQSKYLNPKTNKPITPSIETYKAVSKATGINLVELVEMTYSD